MQGYYIENRITKEIVKVAANSAQEACQKAGWLIGDCWVSELGVYPFQFRIPKKEDAHSSPTSR